jgi:hypothetical protein
LLSPVLSPRIPAACALAVWLAAGSIPAAAGEVVEVDGVPHVKNAATPAEGVHVAELEELWRVGGEDDDTLIGLITDVLEDEDGNLYLLDTQLSEVKVFSPDGEFLRTLSREGDGPGEVRRPADMAILPDGTLGLAQIFPGKLTKIDLDGNPAGEMTVGGDPSQGGFAILRDVQCAGGNLVLCPTMISPQQGGASQTRTDCLASFNTDGTIGTRYLEREYTWDFTNFSLVEEELYFVFPRRFAVDPDGRVVAAPYRDRYALNIYERDGTLARVIEREYEGWQRTAADREIIEAMFGGMRRRMPFEFETTYCETEPAITALQYTRDGHLWVETSRGTRDNPDGIMLTFDVFDPEGHFARQVALPLDASAIDDAVILNDTASRLILVKGFTDGLLTLQGGSRGEGDAEEGDDEPAPMEVVVYAMK